MPSEVRSLPCCTKPLSIRGEFCIEIFCGLASLTLGLVMSEVPCVRPWDAMYGDAFDVLANDFIILQLIESGRIILALFGVSMTWARWR